MNVRYLGFLLIHSMVSVFLTGCVKEEAEECGPEGIDIYLYSRTLCQNETNYPEEINNILIGVFDANETLINYTLQNNVQLQSGYFIRLETKPGLHTVVAWSGLNETTYTLTDLQTGITKKEDWLFHIKREEGVASLIEESIFQGESTAVYIPENKTTEEEFETASVNMLEITNRIQISVEGLPVPADYEIIIEGNNTSMIINGTIADDETLSYSPSSTTIEYNHILHSVFTILKLETGHNLNILIRETSSGNELFRGNLLGALLLKNPEVNLACDHDFTINFTAEDQCECGTYTITEIWVNNWLVHSYDTNI
ncbi:MAG: FimB/Mfa2 family fimbrial subunit [Tannerellaceae bacterium]|nr:FimB/Mfa2 family fimbrial subunit [Tannerellaceae bacterium]